MIKAWIFFVSRRYLSTKRKNSGLSLSFFNVLGLGIGGMILIGVLSVMNGFQLGYIEDIMEVSSSHIRIEPFGEAPLRENEQEKISNIPGLRYFGPVYELQSLIRGYSPRPRGGLIKGIPKDIWVEDSLFTQHVEIIQGERDLAGSQGILVGSEMARNLGVRLNDRIDVLSLGGEDFDLVNPEEIQFTVTGVFHTGYHEFDLNMAFIDLDEQIEFLESSGKLSYKIKLDDPSLAPFISQSLGKTLGEGFRVRSWDQYNQAFFSALRMEKMTMAILLGLIFVVVGLNIFHSMERSILEKKEELGLLKALGATTHQVQKIFLMEGAILGLLGGLLGLVLGLQLSYFVNEIIALLESIINWFQGIDGNYALYSGSSFYLNEIPVRILGEEVIGVFLFTVISSIGAAWLASKKVTGIRSAQVLRAE